MSGRYKVICSGLDVRTRQRTHGEISFPDLTIGDDGVIQEAKTRRAPAPGRGPVKAVVQAESHREANGSWRWKCGKCGRDARLTEAHLRRWMDAINEQSTTVLDISILP